MSSLSDLLDHFKLDAEINPGHTLHVTYRPNRARGLRKEKVETKWHKKRSIGEGSFGEVWLEEERSSDVVEQRAVKVIKKRMMRRWGIDYERELSALAKFSKSQHQQEEVLVKFFGWFDDVETVCLAMEYFEHGDLAKYISTQIPEHECKQITSNLLEGLKIMHAESFTHRDLKPQNIFIVQRPPAAPVWWVKIGDFGITKRVKNERTALRSSAGTPLFQAPEICGYVEELQDQENSKYDNSVDIWSLGCVIYNIIACQVPFPNSFSIMKFSQGRLSFPHEPLSMRSSSAGIDFVKSLLVPLPSNRVSATEALHSQWLLDSHEPLTAIEPLLAESLQTDNLASQHYNHFDSNDIRTPSKALSTASRDNLVKTPKIVHEDLYREQAFSAGSMTWSRQPEAEISQTKQPFNSSSPIHPKAEDSTRTTTASIGCSEIHSESARQDQNQGILNDVSDSTVLRDTSLTTKLSKLFANAVGMPSTELKDKTYEYSSSSNTAGLPQKKAIGGENLPEYFVRANSIVPRVMRAQISKYFGLGASCRAGYKDGFKGYFVSAKRSLPQAMINDLQAASRLYWEEHLVPTPAEDDIGIDEVTRSKPHCYAKLVILGLSCVGKSSLLRSALGGEFQNKTKKLTSAVEFIKCQRQFPELIINLEIVDTNGLILDYAKYCQAQAALIVYDCTNPFGLIQALSQKSEIERSAPGTLIVLAGNKVDLKGKTDFVQCRVERELECMEKWQGCITSAKTGHNVSNLFTAIARAIADSMSQKG